MLIKFFPSLGDNIIVKYIKRGLESRYSAILIAALTLLSNLFSLEIPVMYAYAVIVALATLFCDDLLCLIPMALCAYFLFSKVNNPLDKAHTSIFLGTEGLLHLAVAAVIIAIFTITRWVFEFMTHKERRKLPKLTWGFVALGGAYVLGGIFSSYASLETSFFGLVQILALAFSYYYFYFTVDFKKVDKSHFAYLMTVVGFLLCGEVLGMLYYGGFFEAVGGFNRGNLYTGWGIYNNVAGAMIMCMPAPFYYAATKKNGWPFLLLGNLFFAALLFIQSRGGMVFGAVLYGLCVLVTIWKAPKKKALILTELGLLLIVGVVALIFHDKIADMFMSIIQVGMNDSGRFEIYKDGLTQFLDFPIFGNGFYACQNFRWGDNSIGKFLPARYHNTYVQLLASGGMVAFIMYFFHRVQTLWMLFRKRSVEKYFIALCIFGLLLTSLLDCHFFNFGPGLTYSALLLFLEMDHLKKAQPPKEHQSLQVNDTCTIHLYNLG